MSAIDELDVVRSSDNIFRDFGHPDADILHMKADLAAKIIHELDTRHLSVRGASALTGFSAADFSRVRRAKVQGFTLDKMIGMLGRLDQGLEVGVSVRQRSERDDRAAAADDAPAVSV